MIEQANFTYSSLRKAFEKQIKTIKDQERQQMQGLEVLKLEEDQQNLILIEGIFLKEMRTNEIKNEIKNEKMKL